MKLRTAQSAVIFWADGKPVWDGYVDQKQYHLSPDAVKLLSWFSEGASIDSVAKLADGNAADLERLALQMLATGALIEVGSTAADDDMATREHWKPWGTAARYYHYASRTLRSAAYMPVEDDRGRLREKALQEPPPALVHSLHSTWQRALADIGDQPLTMTLDEALTRRRSVREFNRLPISLTALSTLLHKTLGLVPRAGRRHHEDGSMFRTSPSGGARHPVEGLVYVRSVDGLDPGYYHYDHAQHALHFCAEADVADAVTICGGQPWVDDAAAILYYIGVTGRSMWKYNTLRAYRALMMDVGHLSQTAFLVTTAMGLGATYTAALRDEVLEDIYGLDGRKDVVLGATVIGVPDPDHLRHLHGDESLTQTNDHVQKGSS